MSLKIFSDNILISAKTHNTEEGRRRAGKLIVNYLCFFQINCLLKGNWLLQGCISIGSLFINDVFVWGKGLIEAYKGVTKRVHYPRIIIDPSITSLFSEKDTDETTLVDFDNEIYVNHYFTLRCLNKSSRQILLKFKDLFTKLYNDNKHDLRLRQLFYWHIQYHNNFCVKHKLLEYKIIL